MTPSAPIAADRLRDLWLRQMLRSQGLADPF
jgi:hypothetical protein